MKYLIIYLAVMNISAFSAMLIDKKKAEHGRWRIKESTLLLLAGLGGSVGAIAGMFTFRHKTKKAKFFIGFPMILIFQAAIAFLVFNYFYGA